MNELTGETGGLWTPSRGGVSGLACRAPRPPHSTREETADVHCGVGSWGARCLSLRGYVTGTGATSGAPAAGGR